MLRRSLLLLLPLSFLAGCMKPAMPMESPKKPAVPAEMKKLERFLGNWTGAAEMVEPSPEKMKEMMPEAERAKFKNSYPFGGKTEWAFGGMMLKSEGWYEMGEGLKATYVEYWNWDTKKKKFHTVFVSDWGEWGEGWVWPCGKCDGFKSEAVGYDTMGNKKKMKGCIEMRDDKTMEWHFTEHGPYGKMTMKGISKKQ